MPDPRLPNELDQVAASIDVWPRGLGELRYLLGSLPPLSPNSLPGSAPAFLPPDDGTVASTGTGGADANPTGSTEDTLSGPVPGSIPGSAITSGTLRTTAFASSIRPVTLVTALPGLPNALYPEGAFVYKTNDSPPRLYKVQGGAWVPGIGTNDLPDGSITATKILDGSITTPKMTANSISGDRITAGTLDATKIVADSITAGQIAVGAITASELHADAVTAAAIQAGAVTTAKLSVGDEMSGNLCPNGSFQNGVPAQVYGYGYSAVTQAADGVSDGKCLDIAVVNASTEGRYAWAEMPLVGGRTVTVSFKARNPGAGSPTGEWWLLCRRSGTAVGGFDYAYLAGSGIFADGGAWQTVDLGTVTLASDVVSGFVVCGIISNPGVGAGYTSHMRYEDVMVEYGSARTGYRPSLVGSNVVIDSSGITVTNGALTVQDANGKTWISGGAIATGAIDFDQLGSGAYDVISSNVPYNSFVSATAGALAVGANRDDAAGHTANCPGWTVWRSTGAATDTIVADTAYPGGKKASIGFAALGTSSTNNIVMTTDLLPVMPGAYVTPVWVRGYHTAVAGGPQVSMTILFYKADRSLLSTSAATQKLGGYVGAVDVVAGRDTWPIVAVPSNARYARIEFSIYEVLIHDAGNRMYIGSVGLLNRWDDESFAGTLSAETGVKIGSGTNYVGLFPMVTNTLNLVGSVQVSGGTDSVLGYKFNGTAVVGARKTGWGAPTGTATRTAFATDTVTLINLARAVKALIDDLRTHGLIGT
jgi:hypothetical protein